MLDAVGCSRLVQEEKNVPNSRVMLSNVVDTSHVWLFKFKLIKIKLNKKFNSLSAPATFKLLNNPLWPVGTISDGTDVEYFSLFRKSR